VAIYLITPTSLELKAEVDEIDVPQVKVGQHASIEVDAITDTLFDGTVTSISPVPKIETGLVVYEVTISLAIPADAGVKVGMSTTADIIVAESDDTLLVPERAISHDQNGNPVVQVSINGQLEEREVEVGISDGLNTEILSGVSEGDTVAVTRRTTTGTGGLF
jgi:HlyD family secretion protein